MRLETMPNGELVLWIASIASLGAWIYLWRFRAAFWRADQRLDEQVEIDDPPTVTAVIPARDEADVIGESIASLLAQDYPGRFSIVLVDDASGDGTAKAAEQAALQMGMPYRLHVVSGEPLEEGWTGKIWAVHQGLAHAAESDAEYYLLTDADIRHDPANLSRLVTKAEEKKLDLVSLMVKLHCRSIWDWLLIPAFVFFFQKLFPFPAVNDPGRKIAAAAGGCMLVRRDAMEKIGGVSAIKSAIIDDCALAKELKRNGPVWLGLTGTTESIRAYDRLGEIWRMVARSAYAQLNHSILLLLGTVIGMAIVYLAPPAVMQLALLWDATIPMLIAGAAWGLMAALTAPTFRLYGLAPVYGLLLPIAGIFYLLMTLDSARRHWLNKGGAWKGRTYG